MTRPANVKVPVRAPAARPNAGASDAGVVAATHLVVSDYGVKKRKHADFDGEQAQAVYLQQVLPAAQALAGSNDDG